MEGTSIVGQLDQVKRIQRVVRIINMICAGTGVGLIITFLIMNAQLIFGNGMGIPMVPKLEGPELLIVLLLDFLMVLAIIINLAVLVTIFGMFGGNTGGIGSSNTSGIDTRIVTGFNK